MNLQLKEIAVKAQVEHCISHVRLEQFAELILSKVMSTVVNTDIRSVVYTSHDKDRAEAVLTLVAKSLQKEFNITEKV
jgi:hypothetical protein